MSRDLIVVQVSGPMGFEIFIRLVLEARSPALEN
jgi:hypothetical protein